MSTFTPVEITCLHCGKPFTVEILEGIHITRLPEVRRQILDGSFQVFECPSCGGQNPVENDTVYTDFDRYHYVAVASSTYIDWRSTKAEQAIVFENSFDNGPPVAQELGQQFVHRLAPDWAGLREKLLVWDADLDDRAVEAVKGERQRELEIPHHAEMWRVSSVLDGGHLVFARLAADDGPSFALTGHETVPNEKYTAWAGDPENLSWEFPLLLDHWVVDLFVLEWADRPGVRSLEPEPGPKGRPHLLG